MILFRYLFFVWIFLAGTMPAFVYGQYQGSTEDNNIWQAQAGDSLLVYGRMANVRLKPFLDAAVQDSLPCGTPVVIRKVVSARDQLKGIYANWAKVNYSAHGIAREGYVWLGLLSLGKYTKDGVRFLYGLERIETPVKKGEDDYRPSVWYFRVKALAAGGQVLDEQEAKIDALETSVTEGKLLGDMGLSNTTDILRINFGGEACGIPTYYFYFGWTGSKLLALPGKMEVGDAGVFYHNETFLFPRESGGKPGMIIKLTEEGEAQEETEKDGEPVFTVKKTRMTFLWDGTRARKQ